MSHHVGVDILISRKQNEKASFERTRSDTITGERNLRKDRSALPEYAWDNDDKVVSFKKMLWKLLRHESFPAGKTFEKQDNKQLNGTIKHLFDAESFYFPINFEDKDEDDKLIDFFNDKACCERLKEDLPKFTWVKIEIGEEGICFADR